MRFSIALLVASASAAVMIATPAQAYDFRQLVAYKDYASSTDFCNAWNTNCKDYVPKDKSLKYGGSVCEPGDYHGKHKKTEAKVACVFLHDGDKSKPQAVNKHIAAKTHATFITGDD